MRWVAVITSLLIVSILASAGVWAQSEATEITDASNTVVDASTDEASTESSTDSSNENSTDNSNENLIVNSNNDSAPTSDLANDAADQSIPTPVATIGNPVAADVLMDGPVIVVGPPVVSGPVLDPAAPVDPCVKIGNMTACPGPVVDPVPIDPVTPCITTANGTVCYKPGPVLGPVPIDPVTPCITTASGTVCYKPGPVVGPVILDPEVPSVGPTENNPPSSGRRHRNRDTPTEVVLEAEETAPPVVEGFGEPINPRDFDEPDPRLDAALIAGTQEVEEVQFAAPTPAPAPTNPLTGLVSGANAPVIGLIVLVILGGLYLRFKK